MKPYFGGWWNHKKLVLSQKFRRAIFFAPPPSTCASALVWSSWQPDRGWRFRDTSNKSLVLILARKLDIPKHIAWQKSHDSPMNVPSFISRHYIPFLSNSHFRWPVSSDQFEVGRPEKTHSWWSLYFSLFRAPNRPLSTGLNEQAIPLNPWASGICLYAVYASPYCMNNIEQLYNYIGLCLCA